MSGANTELIETDHAEADLSGDAAAQTEPMDSPRDPPLWIRAVAIGLLLFASWWLFETDTIKDVVGDSIGVLCLGVIALSILQGMHLPLGVWPDGPWRKRFSVPAVIGTALILAAMILISKSPSLAALVDTLDLGTDIAVVGGTVALGFGFGFVRQRRYLRWYGIALLLALLPTVAGLAAGAQSNILLPSLVYLSAVGTASKLVTEEIAFRRLLIGASGGDGLLIVLVSAVTSLAWYVLLTRSNGGGVETVAIGSFGALSAGCLYALSRSLVVSALFNAVYSAGFAGIDLATSGTNIASTGAGVSSALWIAASAPAIALAIVTVRKYGFFGNLMRTASLHVTRN